jgi:hypothetical protein
MTVQARVTLWVLGLAFVALAAVLQGVAPPEGWFAFEFPAWSGVDPGAWSQFEREGVFFGLGLDYLFIFVYAAFVTVLGGAVGARIPAEDVCRSCLPKLSLWIWAAALADALENWGLHCWLGEGEGWLVTISIVATVKWLFVALMVILQLVGLWKLLAWRHKRG